MFAVMPNGAIRLLLFLIPGQPRTCCVLPAATKSCFAVAESVRHRLENALCSPVLMPVLTQVLGRLSVLGSSRPSDRLKVMTHGTSLIPYTRLPKEVTPEPALSWKFRPLGVTRKVPVMLTWTPLSVLTLRTLTGPKVLIAPTLTLLPSSG